MIINNKLKIKINYSKKIGNDNRYKNDFIDKLHKKYDNKKNISKKSNFLNIHDISVSKNNNNFIIYV